MTTSATAQTSANTTGSLQSNQTGTIDCVGGRAAIVRSNNDLWKPLKSRRRYRKEAAAWLRDLACKQLQGSGRSDWRANISGCRCGAFAQHDWVERPCGD